MLTLKPYEFEDLQIREFNAMVQGYLQRKRDNDVAQAYFTYWQLRPHLGKDTTLTPADILVSGRKTRPGRGQGRIIKSIWDVRRAALGHGSRLIN